MAQSPTERVTALERMADVLTTRLDGLDKGADKLSNAHAEMAKELASLKRDFDREVALLKREVDELKKGKEEWGRKLWMIVPPVLAALISSVVTLIVALSLRK